jgi:hypothetical protein
MSRKRGGLILLVLGVVIAVGVASFVFQQAQRATEKARSAAAGSPVPAGQEPVDPDAAPAVTAQGRGAMRRRVRRLRHTREVLVRELGALVRHFG